MRRVTFFRQRDVQQFQDLGRLASVNASRICIKLGLPMSRGATPKSLCNGIKLSVRRPAAARPVNQQASRAEEARLVVTSHPHRPYLAIYQI